MLAASHRWLDDTTRWGCDGYGHHICGPGGGYHPHLQLGYHGHQEAKSFDELHRSAAHSIILLAVPAHHPFTPSRVAYYEAKCISSSLDVSLVPR